MKVVRITIVIVVVALIMAFAAVAVGSNVTRSRDLSGSHYEIYLYQAAASSDRAMSVKFFSFASINAVFPV
jgi:hypothetical protein